MKAFNESLRYEYSLTPESLVIDAGGYEGNWFRQIHEKYKCRILVFEPVYEYWLTCSIVAHKIANKLPEENEIQVFRLGLGGSYYRDTYGVSGDSAGAFCQSGANQKVDIVQASVIIRKNEAVDLLKLNIEGMEYHVLQDLINNGQISKVKNIQVQFHFNFPGAKNDYASIREQLLITHEPEWDSEPVWQNFKLKQS